VNGEIILLSVVQNVPMVSVGRSVLVANHIQDMPPVAVILFDLLVVEVPLFLGNSQGILLVGSVYRNLLVVAVRIGFRVGHSGLCRHTLFVVHIDRTLRTCRIQLLRKGRFVVEISLSYPSAYPPLLSPSDGPLSRGLSPSLKSKCLFSRSKAPFRAWFSLRFVAVSIW